MDVNAGPYKEKMYMESLFTCGLLSHVGGGLYVNNTW